VCLIQRGGQPLLSGVGNPRLELLSFEIVTKYFRDVRIVLND
jgi:hypothetical protein